MSYMFEIQSKIEKEWNLTSFWVKIFNQPILEKKVDSNHPVSLSDPIGQEQIEMQSYPKTRKNTRELIGKWQIENIVRKPTSDDMTPLEIKYIEKFFKTRKRETNLPRKELSLS